jgi:hypothetical protein
MTLASVDGVDVAAVSSLRCGGVMAQGKRAERIQIMLTVEEVRAVDNWRFANSMPSRSAAVRALLNLGLAANHEGRAQAMLEADISSSSVGVVDNDPDVSSALGTRAGGILVVDGNPLAARGLCWLVESAGWRAVGPAFGFEDASEHLSNGISSLAAVISEMQIGGKTAEPFLHELADRRLPLLFCSDHSVKTLLPEPWWTTPTISRQSAPTSLVPTLRRLLGTPPAGQDSSSASS